MKQRADRFRRLPRESFDVVVIGAGIGGLTAAALLAKRLGRVVAVSTVLFSEKWQQCAAA